MPVVTLRFFGLVAKAWLWHRYDAFLLDQWGVMHDGSKAHEGAIECMKQLAAAGKKVVHLRERVRQC